MSSFSQFYDVPVLASDAQCQSSPYSDQEWQRMLGQKPDPMASIQTSQNMYNAAMNSMGDRSMQFSSYVAPVMPSSVATPTVPAAPATPAHVKSQSKVIMAGASWCGFSKKAMLAHKAKNVEGMIDTKWCDKEDKDHPLCKKTKGFPTYYKADGTVLKRGYTPNPETLV